MEVFEVDEAEVREGWVGWFEGAGIVWWAEGYSRWGDGDGNATSLLYVIERYGANDCNWKYCQRFYMVFVGLVGLAKLL